MSLSDNVTRIRKQRGLSQNQLARNADISQQNVQRLESGERTNPSFETVCKIADALGVSLDELRGKAKKKKAP